ncbi:hypothetical protein [Pleomorphomonas koreensis]|uniref:hypothetical protein n=1 Tax=Pleomorphomonas koreensis TaxID=257440 RepID=UPI0012EC8BBF|nr:hypothetical protein [Pleomorphomonas koreensis]
MAIDLYLFHCETGEYLEAWIDGGRYGQGYPDIGSFRREVLNRTSLLKNDTIPNVAIDTKVVMKRGETNSHAVVQAKTATPLFFVTGPGGVLFDISFAEISEAVDFATKKASKYDKL